ncbi:hypothetical protein ACWFRF_20745 [Nocardia sp. NPDC055165]
MTDTTDTPLCPVCECDVVDDLVHIEHVHLGEVAAHNECLPIDTMLDAILRARKIAADARARVAELEAAQPKPILLGYLPPVTKPGRTLMPSEHTSLSETPAPGGVAVWTSVPPGGPGTLVGYAVAVDDGRGWFIDTVILDGSRDAADNRCHDWLSGGGYQAIVVELREVTD